MASPPRVPPATPTDLEGLPEHEQGEIIAGVVEVAPRPVSRHRRFASGLGIALGRYVDFGGPVGGWWIEDEPGLDLGIDHYIPDLAGWRRDRHPVYPEGVWVAAVPDWVCEVLSPSTARSDRAVKMPTYRAAGVGHVWLVDVEAAFIEVYRNTSAGWLLVQTVVPAPAETSPAPVCIEPFDEVPIQVKELFHPIAARAEPV